MPGLNNFASKLRDAVEDNAAYDQTIGSLVQLLRLIPNIGDVVDGLNKKQLGALISHFQQAEKSLGKLNVAQAASIKAYGEIITAEGKKAKIDSEILRGISDNIKTSQRFVQQQKVEKEAAIKYFDQRAQHFERERRMLQSQTQMQRDAIDSMEKNFWGPFRNMFKANTMLAYSKDFGQAIGKTMANFTSEYYELAKGVNASILGSLGDRVGSLISDAGQKFGERMMTIGKEAFHALKEGSKEGKEQYYERLREKATLKTEKAMEDFEGLINNSRNIQDNISAKMENSFDGFDDSVSLFGKYIQQATGLVQAQEKDEKDEKSIMSKLSRGVGASGTSSSSAEDEGNKVTASMSALLTGLGNIIPYIGAAAGAAFSALQTMMADLGSHMAELEVKWFNLRASFEQELGGFSAVEGMPGAPGMYMGAPGGAAIATAGGKRKNMANFLQSQYNLQYGVDIQDIQDSYVGLQRSFGDINKMSPELIEYQIKFNKLLGLSGEEGGQLSKIFQTIGENIHEAGENIKGSDNFLEDLRQNVDKFAKVEGVSAKDVMRDLAKQVNWIAMVGSPQMVTEFERSDAQLRAMGLHADTMLKITGGFEDVNAAMKNTFELNKVLGTSFNPVRMNIMAMMGDMSGIQNDVVKALGNIGRLNALQVKGVSQVLGITEQEVRLLQDGAKIQADVENNRAGMADIEKEILNIKKVQKRLNEAGLSDDQKKEFMAKKIAGIFQKHQDEFMGNFDAFEKALANPNNELGQKMKHELTVAMEPSETPKTLEAALVAQTDWEKLQEHHLDQIAEDTKGAIVALNSTMGVLNKLLAVLLSKALKIAGPVLGRAANALGVPEVGEALTTMTQQMGPALNEYSSEALDQQMALGLANRQEVGTIMQEGTSLIDNPTKFIANAVVKGIDQGFQGIENLSMKATSVVIEGVQNLFSGGSKKKAQGGLLTGPGGPTDDQIPIMASNGEYIIPASGVKKWGVSALDSLFKGYAEGGEIKKGKTTKTPIEKLSHWIEGTKIGEATTGALNKLFATFVLEPKNEIENLFNPSGSKERDQSVANFEANADYHGGQFGQGINNISNIIATGDALEAGISLPKNLKNLKNLPKIVKSLKNIIEHVDEIPELYKSAKGVYKAIEGGHNMLEQGHNMLEQSMAYNHPGLAGDSNTTSTKRRASYAVGTLPSQSFIPGFVNTSDVDQLMLHPQESVQVMNSQQKVQRDNALEDLIQEIRNLVKTQSSGPVIETDIKWNNEVIGRMVIKALYNKVV